jgi:type IV fimbrial biogenesis protein FimT
MSTPRRSPRGFTLIELLMTVAVLAVLLGLAAPGYAGLMGHLRGSAARSELGTALNLARMSAVNRRAVVLVCPSVDGSRCSHDTRWQHGWLVFEDSDRDGTPSAGERMLSIAQAQPPGVAIVSSAGRLHVAYQPDGSASGSNLTLTVCDRAEGTAGATTLVVSQSGRVRSGRATPPAAAACLQEATES